jgi:hypothetical protein
VNIIIGVGNNPPGGVTGGSWLAADDPPIVSCDDPRLVGSNTLNEIVTRGIPTMTYSTAICDGSAIVRGHDIMTSGPDNVPYTYEVVSAGEICYSPIGLVPLSPPILRGSGGPLLGELFVSPVSITYSVQDNGATFLVTFVDYTTVGSFTVRLSDSKECPTYVTLTPFTGVCPQNVTEEAEAGNIDPVMFDCIITSNETVPDAVVEIEACVANNQPIIGSDAPLIYLPVTLVGTPQMTMEFLQYNSSLYVPGTFAYLQNVNMIGANSSITLAATIVSASNGIYDTTIILPGNVDVGGPTPNQQVTFQYGTLDGSTLVALPGTSTLVVFLAHTTVVSMGANISRGGVNMQLIQSSIGLLNLYTPDIQTFLTLSNDGSSPIGLLRVFVAGVNATSNSTMQVVCHYILNYPKIVLTAQAGNNGTLVVTSDQCIDFGTVVTPSQSRSMNKFPIYKQQTTLPQSLFLFAFAFVFVVIMGLMIVLVQGIERRH